ncbi:DUF1433 domain-containing protein [Staphylococcus simulans]
MNKKIILITLCSVVLIFTVLKLWDWKQQHDKEVLYLDRQKEKVTLYMEHNLKEYKSITFTKEKVNRMGIKILEGYVNDNKNMNFSVNAHVNNFYYFNGNGDLEASRALKAAFKPDKKTVNQIEEEMIQEEKEREKRDPL